VEKVRKVLERQGRLPARMFVVESVGGERETAMW